MGEIKGVAVGMGGSAVNVGSRVFMGRATGEVDGMVGSELEVGSEMGAAVEVSGWMTSGEVTGAMDVLGLQPEKIVNSIRTAA